MSPKDELAGVPEGLYVEVGSLGGGELYIGIATKDWKLLSHIVLDKARAERLIARLRIAIINMED